MILKGLSLTSGHHIIMGRKTFESFQTQNRTHIVITRQKNYNPDGCIVDSIENACNLS
jgi:dihydrofolate reductase